MQPCTEENHLRIEKHRRQRQGLGFQTLECPYQIGDAPVSTDGVVLLEDVSNLLANAVFEKGNSAENVFLDICALAERCAILVAVTISGLKDEGYEGETADYIHGLNDINKRLFEKAAVAITMRDGIPVCQKGDIHDLF